MASEKPSLGVAAFFAWLANNAGNMSVEKWAALVGILAGAFSIAVSIKNLLNKPAPHVA